MKKGNLASNLLTVALAIGIVFQQSIVVRAPPPGDPDLHFGINGVKTDLLQDRNMHVGSIAQQADGKLLVAGKMTLAGNGYTLLLLRRYNTDGSVDTEFGSSGFGVEMLNHQPFYIYGSANISDGYPNQIVPSDGQNSLLVQTDGKIVVAGGAYDFGTSQTKPAVFRFLASGRLDTSFGNQGRVIFHSSGKAIGLETYRDRLLTRIGSALVRLNSDGSIDTAFGSAGVANIGIYSSTFTVNRSTGKIVVGGSVPSPASSALQHFNTNGTPDTDHGIDGIAVLDLNGPCVGQADFVTSLDTQADGKVLAAGFRVHSTQHASNFFIRLLPDDTLDTSFSSDGFAVGCAIDNAYYGWLPRIRASRTTTQSLARTIGDPDSNTLRRYSSGGSSQLAFPYAIDFLTQTNDEKIVTATTRLSNVRYYIQLRRFIP